MDYVLIIVFGVLLIYFGFKWGLKNQYFFRERGVKYHKPLPFLGNSLPIFTNECTLKHVLNLCKDFRKEKIFGMFDLMTPVLVIQDPNLVKDIVVRGFDHFTDHQPIASKGVDSFLTHALFFMNGNKWRQMRSNIRPIFTGGKIRFTFNLMVDICNQMVTYLRTETQKGEQQEFEVRDFFNRCTTDIIGSCAFGIKVNSLSDIKNEFFTNTNEMFDISSPIFNLKLLGATICPSLMKFFGIAVFTKKNRDYIKRVTLDGMTYRVENNISRHDMINVLIEAQKRSSAESGDSKKISWSQDEIIAQSFLFILAGLETSATALAFATYEIASNPEIQEKLFHEMNSIHGELEGASLTFEILSKIKYLDMVVSETLRKWPGFSFIDRLCTKDFTLEYEEGKTYTFRKGDVLWIPAADYHRNPKYFSNPEKFDPERFSDENATSIKESTYLPFGMGPRSCLGSRFAMMEVKAMIYYLITNFHMELSSKTDYPLSFKGAFVGLHTRSGIWVKFRPRREKSI